MVREASNVSRAGFICHGVRLRPLPFFLDHGGRVVDELANPAEDLALPVLQLLLPEARSRPRSWMDEACCLTAGARAPF